MKEMIVLWNEYVQNNNVIISKRSPFESLEDEMPKRFPIEKGYPPLLYKKQFIPPKDMIVEPKN